MRHFQLVVSVFLSRPLGLPGYHLCFRLASEVLYFHHSANKWIADTTMTCYSFWNMGSSQSRKPGTYSTNIHCTKMGFALLIIAEKLMSSSRHALVSNWKAVHIWFSGKTHSFIAFSNICTSKQPLTYNKFTYNFTKQFIFNKTTIIIILLLQKQFYFTRLVLDSTNTLFTSLRSTHL